MGRIKKPITKEKCLNDGISEAEKQCRALKAERAKLFSKSHVAGDLQILQVENAGCLLIGDIGTPLWIPKVKLEGFNTFGKGQIKLVDF